MTLHKGAQVAVDAILVTPLTRQGQARPRAHWQDGAALLNARKDKAKKYPELLRSHRCRLVTAGMEMGGRWEDGTYELLLDLARAKAKKAPKLLRVSETR